MQTIIDKGPYRWFSNVDITSDPSEVKWSVFLSDERYQYDGLGVFLGGYTYNEGVWRPSETSIMETIRADSTLLPVIPSGIAYTNWLTAPVVMGRSWREAKSSR